MNFKRTGRLCGQRSFSAGSMGEEFGLQLRLECRQAEAVEPASGGGSQTENSVFSSCVSVR